MDYRYLPFYMQGNAITGMYYGNVGLEQDTDIEYVKEMYPKTCMVIQEAVETECDMQEFAGSMMFDEYPDKLGIFRMVNKIYEKIKEEEKICDEACVKYPEEAWLKDIIQILLLNEMYRRRKNHKRYY